MVKYSLSLLQGVLSCMKMKGLGDPHPLGFPAISTLESSVLPFYSCKPAHSWDSHGRIWQRCCEGSGSQHKVFGCLKQGMQHLLGAGNHSRVVVHTPWDISSFVKSPAAAGRTRAADVSWDFQITLRTAKTSFGYKT